MRIFRLKRENTFSTHAIGNCQIYLGDVSTLDGKISKGIAVLGGDQVIEFPFILTSEEAVKLHQALLAVEAMSLPRSHSVRFGWFNYLTFKFSKHIESWPEGGGVSGWVALTLYGKLWPGTASLNSIKKLRSSLAAYFELERESNESHNSRT
jgi:hypothetical protein